jgi:hypothetical protein
MEQMLNESNFKATPPADYNSTGTAGEYSVDDDYFYICYATDKWFRMPGSKNF